MKKLLLIALLLATPALAHTLHLFAYSADGKVYTESQFPNGRPVQEGKVLVFDSADEQLLAGLTDQEGRFNFQIPKLDDLRIVIETSMGHRAHFSLKKSALEMAQ